jgi:hypothetical protein
MELMNENFPPAIAMLKRECPLTPQSLTPLLAQMLADKGMDQATVRFLAAQSPRFLGTLFGHLLLRSPHALALRSLLYRSFTTLSLPDPQYQGTRSENVQIDASFAQPALEAGSGLRSLTWRGAAGAYESEGFVVPRQMGSATRIVIIGAGAAGLLAARALLNAGFSNVLLLDQTGQYGGVWNQVFLAGASRANPFPLRFEECRLEAAPGPGGAVMHWLRAVMQHGMQLFPLIVKARVLEVRPGDLAHRVLYEDERGARCVITAPIVVNAVGVGEPLPPSRPGVMTTDIEPMEAGKRWQEVWTPEQARGYHGRTCVFISLSNSTLEMVKQIQRYRREGLDINYRIITHYPQTALDQPLNVVIHRGHKMRLYRNPARFQLLRLAGDLPEVASAFEEARDTGHITSHIMHWTLEHGEQRQVVTVREDGVIQRFVCDELYTLIGYGPQVQMLREMGLSVNHPYLGAVDLDYDSEVQRTPGMVGRERIFPGYFCLGIRNAFNMNEVLLPGILYRLPDLVAGVVLRAIEYWVRSKPR